MESSKYSSALVVLIYGASGSGKSSLLEFLHNAGRQYSINIKGTDRPQRQYDGIEIKSVPSVLDTEYEYIYKTYGHRYGIQRKQIDESIRLNSHHFIICNDISTIRDIKRDYGDKVRLIFHYFDAPKEELLKIQTSRNISDDEINVRLTKIDALYRIFIQEHELFDDVLYNQFGQSPQILLDGMGKILERQTKKYLNTASVHNKLDQLVDIVQKQVAVRTVGSTQPVDNNYSFIMMAMAVKDDLFEDVYPTLKRTANNFNIRAERVDEIQFTGQITEKILSSIRLSLFVIADLTYERPNVYYEIGYAHALRKPVILIAKKDTPLHFDLQGMNVHFYKNMSELEDKLTKAIAGIKDDYKAQIV